MEIIQFKEANCQNCYKCIRHCPVKSIKFSDEQAKILEDDCIYCGNCVKICPQNAKDIKSDLDKVKGFIKANKKVVVSLAPSYVAAFPNKSLAQISSALKKLGFYLVEETAIGANEVSRVFDSLIKENKMDNIITTCCPTIVLLVQKYYPNLCKYLAPVISPALAHTKMIKASYGEDVKTVFIGPCISKKYEETEGEDLDAVLIFDELNEWFKEEGINLKEEEDNYNEVDRVVNRLYPIPGGILETLQSEEVNYKRIAIDGIDRCIEILDSLEKNDIKGYFFEMSSCLGSCVEGPGLREFSAPFLISKDIISENAKTKSEKPFIKKDEANINFDYKKINIEKAMPSEKEIKEILGKIGKTSEKEMFNCAACGYPTCREKAIAVYQGKAELKMCIPFMRQKAESMSNVVLDTTPNALIILDKELNIVEYNAATYKIFNIADIDYVGLPAEMLIGQESVCALRDGKALSSKRVSLEDGKLLTEQTSVNIEDTQLTLVVIQDITEEDSKNKELIKLREETVEIAQKVIDKQMRTAQEIASLLGETTGETKAALTKLKKSISNEEKL